MSLEIGNANKTQEYDVVIIGVGQAGKPLATAFAEAGHSTAIIERNLVGGSCINFGCTPTKAMIASANVAYLTQQAEEYGVMVKDSSVDLQKVYERKEKIVKSFRNGVKKSMENQENLTLIYGHARFTDKMTLEVELNEGKGKLRLKAGKVFINTGARPSVPDFKGLDQIDYLTASSIQDLTEVPEELLIVGGGYIGLEFGQMFSRFGSKVTIVERGSQLLSREDEDVANALKEILEAEGITVLLEAEVDEFNQSAGQNQARVKTKDGTQVIPFSKCLLALGVTPNTDDLGLEAAGVETDEKGYVQVNGFMETSQPGIYALGDVKGGPAFTHVSYDDFRIVKGHLLENKSRQADDRLLPFTVFTNPQLGRVGLNENQAQEKGLDYRIACLPMEQVARAIETGETRGFMKVLISKSDDQILGASILGLEGGEIMSALQIAMLGKVPYTAIRDSMFAHPTLLESLNTLFSSVD
jgi:pyruvate/2-oxoglutarate dehydrogenase complex dihydrolipoamide dehydrogenase (E3) component